MKTKQRKRILLVVVVVLIVAIAFAYVLPLTALATDDPSIIPPETGTIYTPVPEEEEPEPPLLRILDAAVRLDVGQSYTFTCEMKNFPAGTMIEWSSSDPETAGIGSDGKLLAYKPGSVEVVARAGNMQSSVFVTVNKLAAKGVLITVSDKLAKVGDKRYEVKVGEVVRFGIKINPEGAKVNKITWILGNDQVAALTANGASSEFVAEKKGDTQIIVQADTLTDAIVVSIVENEGPIDRLIGYIPYIVGGIAVIIALAVILTHVYQKRQEKEARRKAAAAKRRKEEAERRAREKAEAAEFNRQTQEMRPPQTEERATMKVNGTAVGAGAGMPRGSSANEPERPLTLDDLE